MNRTSSRSFGNIVFVLAVIAAGLLLLFADPVSAQTTTGTTSGTTTGTTTNQPGTTPPSGTRQGTITNQFNSATAGSIATRAPGTWISQAIAEHNGDTTFLTGTVPTETPNFFRDTFNKIFTEIATSIQTLLSGLNALITSSTGTGTGTGGTGTGTGTTAFTPIPNATTTGQGTTTTLP